MLLLNFIFFITLYIFICKGEKRKGGRCSMKAKKGEYCEIHTTEEKEMRVYDKEDIKRRGGKRRGK